MFSLRAVFDIGCMIGESDNAGRDAGGIYFQEATSKVRSLPIIKHVIRSTN